ncbi:hypothetical protein HMPREF9714_03306 [Myroides odoratimimus CCUG 12901]|uniref:hypothetical protein n=1 Tax=Myroides odoratimimus TaxID=76832 RepID=UPI0002460F50|nr:hypothetical protein [Myroides odoratimimus]EHO05368.1 hypothetical protein HMPREF9714_03306 [Myroides odoratimimus CCUG 12901]
MINEKLSIRIKSILGHRYTPKIQTHLTNNKVFNAQGNPFSDGYVRQIVNGIKEDLRIEEEILKLCEDVKEHYTNVKNRKQKLLKSN